MKISVYPRGANPRVDRHIQRKSLEYCTQQVELYGTAKWVDPSNHSKGIVCIDFLYLGEKITAPPTSEQLQKLKKQLSKLRSALPPVEVGGCKFVPPASEKNETLPRLVARPVTQAAYQWDWSQEAVTA